MTLEVPINGAAEVVSEYENPLAVVVTGKGECCGDGVLDLIAIAGVAKRSSLCGATTNVEVLVDCWSKGDAGKLLGLASGNECPTSDGCLPSVGAEGIRISRLEGGAL